MGGMTRAESLVEECDQPASASPIRVLTMVWTERLDAARIGAKVGNNGIYALAQIVNARLVGTKVDLSLLGAISVRGEFGHDSRPK